MTSPSFPVGVRRPLPSMVRGFNGEHGAADFGPGEAGGQTDFVLLFEPEFAVLEDAEEFIDVFRRDLDGSFGAISHHAAGHLAGDILNFAFEVAHTRFVGVVADHVQQAFIGEGEILVG